MELTKSAQLMFERAFTDEVIDLISTDPAAFRRMADAMLVAFQLGREQGRAEALMRADEAAPLDDGESQEG